MTRASIRRRGRPRNSGWDDSSVVSKVEAALRSEPGTSVRKAIISVMGDDAPADIRRIERKLKAIREMRADSTAFDLRIGHAVESGSVVDIHEVMDRLGIERRLKPEEVVNGTTFQRYVDDHRGASALVELNAHEFAYDHRTIASVGRNYERTAPIHLTSSPTGDMEILSPPAGDSTIARMVLLAWEKDNQAVVLSPEEKAAWDATDGAYWRLMNDCHTPFWRKHLPLWTKPDLSMTRALRRIALINGLDAAARRTQEVDFDGSLSFETRSCIPASRMVDLPTRVVESAGRFVRRAAWRALHPAAVVYPWVGGDFAYVFPGSNIHLHSHEGGISVDSVGSRRHEIRLFLRRGSSGLGSVHRAVVDPTTTVETSSSKQSIPSGEAADMILDIEDIADRRLGADRMRKAFRVPKAMLIVGVLVYVAGRLLGMGTGML